MGFDISVAEVTAPAPAACRILKERSLRPHLLVHNGGTTLQQLVGTRRGTAQRDVGDWDRAMNSHSSCGAELPAGV